MQSRSTALKLILLFAACSLFLVFTLGKPSKTLLVSDNVPLEAIGAMEEISLIQINNISIPLTPKQQSGRNPVLFSVTYNDSLIPVEKGIKMLRKFQADGEFFYVKDNRFNGSSALMREVKLSANGSNGKALKSFALDPYGNFFLLNKGKLLKLTTIVNPLAYEDPGVLERILAKKIPDPPLLVSETKNKKSKNMSVKKHPVKAKQCLDYLYCYEAALVVWDIKKKAKAYNIKFNDKPRNSRANRKPTQTPLPNPLPSMTPDRTGTPTTIPHVVATNNPGGRTLKVIASGGGDYLTIKECLDVAVAGDTCIVAPGTYSGPFTFARSGAEGKNILLIAQNQFQPGLAENQRSIITGNVSLKSYNSLIGFDIRNAGVNIAGNNSIVNNNYIHGTGDNSHWGAVQVARTSRTEPYYKNITVKNNFIEQISHGIQIFCSANCLVEGNRVEKLYSRTACRPSGACPGDVDYVRLFGDGIIFRGNFLGNSKLAEIDADAHIDGIQSFNNGSLGGQGRDTFSNSIIENNYIKDCHQPIWWTSIVGGMLSSNVTIRNNVFHNSWGTAARLAIGGPNADRLFVYNNVFNQGVRISAQSYTEVVNNIFIANYTNTHNDKFAWPQGNSIMRNNVFAPGGWITSFIKSVPAVLSSNKFDVKRSDVFLDASQGNFALKAGSPALDYGMDLSNKGFSYDHNLANRPAGKWDAGAFEFN